MRNVFRRLSSLLCISMLFAANAWAQRSVPPAEQQDDSSNLPAPQQRAQAQQRGPGKGEIEEDDPRARMEWQRRDRGIPSVEFKQQLLRLRQSLSGSPMGGATVIPNASTTSGPIWVPIGPTGADYEQNFFTGLVRDSGRARTILPHPTDSNTLYFLSSGGGLWVTHNFTANPSTWTPLTDSLVTTGSGSVAFGRTPSVLYLGLGDPFDLINAGGVMLKSSDGGSTWTNSVDLVNAFSVRDVKVDTSGPQDIVLVATDFGLFRSIDAGVSYAPVTGFGFQGQTVWSLVQTGAGWLLNAQPCGTFVPATFCGTQATIYLSTDHGANWAPISNGGNVYTGAGRTTLAAANPSDSIVYAFAENAASTDQLDLFRSIDGGQTWTALGLNSKTPTNPNNDNPNMDLMHGQSGYNQMILVDPRDPTRNTIYLGGNLSSAKSTDGGNTWTLLSNWLYGNVTLPSGQPAMIPYVHADFHAAALSTAGTPAALLFGSDGGLFVSSDDGATWSSDKNNGLQTFLFYSLISTPGFPSEVLAGSQDNGTRIRKGNTTIYNQSLGGDGLGTGWSQANTNVSVATVEFNNNHFNLTNQVPDLQEEFFFSFPPLINDSVFFTPIETPTAKADPSGKVFFTSSGMLIDKTTDGGWTWTVIGEVGFGGIPSTISLRSAAHAVGVSPVDLLHVGVIAGGGHVEITSDGGNTWTDRALNTLLPGFRSFTESLTWADNQTIYVTSVAPLTNAVRVAKSSDGGASWARADLALPDVPTNRVIVDPKDSTHNTLLAASDLGVFRSTDGGATWAAYGTGLPNVHVSDIYMPIDGSFVRAATYGRGIWELPSLAFAGATLTANVTSCDTNGALDNGGTGFLNITLHNGGSSSLSMINGTVTSTNPNVSFPNTNVITFPTAAASGDTTASINVALNGAVGIQQTDFTIAFIDSTLNLPVPVTAIASFRANYDEIPNSTANDDIGATSSPWTVSGTAQSQPDIVPWERRQITPLEHRWAEIDPNAAADESLISPVLSVGSGAFQIAFEQRYLFSFQGGTSPTWFDGMVLEISTDNGASWTDIGQNASPTYDHMLTVGGGNVLGGKSAYSGISANFPNFTPVTVSLGTLYAGKNVLVRFRVGSGLNGDAPGVEIRNIVATGLTNTPFTATIAHVACPTTTALTSSKNPSVSGDTVTFTATVSSGSNVATGTVTFKDGATAIGTGTLNASAQATFATSSLAVGSHTITASYSGDAANAASISSPLTQTVSTSNMSSSTTLVSSQNPSAFNESVTFTATVTTTSGTPTGTVTFRNGTATLGTGTLSAGTATLTTTKLTVGTHSITAVYSGDANFAGSTSTALPQAVNKAASTISVVSSANPSGLAQAVTFMATVKPATSGTPTGTVTFKDGTTLIGTGTLSGGKAKLTTAALALGSHSITASYGGDANFTASTSAILTQTVKSTTSTTTASSLNPSTFGQTVTFTATVTTTSGTPTGTVTFKNGSATLGTGSLSAATATFTTTKLTVGTHSITAVYSGDTNFAGSTSPALSQAVNKAASTTSVVSSVNPSALGQAVKFTATVKPATSGTPTGTVTFNDGTTVLGTGKLSGGKATLTTSGLALGSHSITASYGGDANFTASTSATLTQTVN
jgi:Big-like domain-containing protein